MRIHLFAATALALAFAGAPLQAREANDALTVPPSGVLGVGEAQLTPAFWIGLLHEPDRVILDRTAIEAQNAKLLQVDPSMHDLRALPKTLGREQVAGWITALSERPDRPLFDVDGQPVPAATLNAAVGNLALGAIPAQQQTRCRTQGVLPR